jgi:hypothetical protein
MVKGGFEVIEVSIEEGVEFNFELLFQCIVKRFTTHDTRLPASFLAGFTV